MVVIFSVEGRGNTLRLIVDSAVLIVVVAVVIVVVVVIFSVEGRGNKTNDGQDTAVDCWFGWW